MCYSRLFGNCCYYLFGRRSNLNEYEFNQQSTDELIDKSLSLKDSTPQKTNNKRRKELNSSSSLVIGKVKSDLRKQLIVAATTNKITTTTTEVTDCDDKSSLSSYSSSTPLSSPLSPAPSLPTGKVKVKVKATATATDPSPVSINCYTKLMESNFGDNNYKLSKTLSNLIGDIFTRRTSNSNIKKSLRKNHLLVDINQEHQKLSSTSNQNNNQINIMNMNHDENCVCSCQLNNLVKSNQSDCNSKLNWIKIDDEKSSKSKRVTKIKINEDNTIIYGDQDDDDNDDNDDDGGGGGTDQCDSGIKFDRNQEEDDKQEKIEELSFSKCYSSNQKVS